MDDLLLNLKTYLDLDDSADNKLIIIINQAISKVVRKRYPFGASDEQKQSALTAYADVILEIALFLYNMQGAEGEKSHSENGISRTYQSIDDFLESITPVAKVRYINDTDTTV